MWFRYSLGHLEQTIASLLAQKAALSLPSLLPQSLVPPSQLLVPQCLKCPGPSSLLQPYAVMTLLFAVHVSPYPTLAPHPHPQGAFTEAPPGTSM